MGEIIRLVRDPDKLQTERFDLLITGAGIFGAAAAWDAALRGYKVALVEQNDFGSGVSANSYKVVHGGIRYIQHLDVSRVRSSCRERSALLRIAPHLVHPLPIAIPTYGYGMSGKPVLSVGMWLYDLLTADRNKAISANDRKIPWARRMDKAETLRLFPGLDSRGLTGAALFSDAQLYNPPRLVLAFLQSAVGKGASICNYARVLRYEVSDDRVTSAHVLDKLSGNTIEIRARAFLNTSGPWTNAVLDQQSTTRRSTPGVYSRDACFVVPRRFDHDTSVAIMGQSRDPDAFLSRPARHLFVVPWRDYSLVGTWHKVVEPTPDKIGITRSEVEGFIAEMHSVYPDLNLSTDEVTMCNWGLVPFGEDQKGGKDLSYGKRSILIDHHKHGGPENMVSLIGIRYTMGRGDAGWAMKTIARKLGDDRSTPRTDSIPLYGGDIGDIQSLVSKLRRQLPEALDDNIAYSLARNYGSRASELLNGSEQAKICPIGASHVLEAQVRHAVEYEMARTLGDIVFRRTDLASGGSPGETALRRCAELAGKYLGLTATETEQQLAAVEDRIPGWNQRR